MANGGPKNKPNLPKYRKEKGTSFNFKKDLEINAGSSDQPYIVYDMNFKSKPSKNQLDKVKANIPMRNGAIDRWIYRYEP